MREDHDLKQSDVAKIINCATYTYQRYEYGVLLIPIDKLIVLADFYDVSTDYMLGRTNNPKWWNKLKKLLTSCLNYAIL